MMADGALEDFRAVVHPDAVNREAEDEPPTSRGRGPAAFYATALWLRDAYAELHWDIHDVIAEGDLVALHCTMSGRLEKGWKDRRDRSGWSGPWPPAGRRTGKRPARA